VIRLCFHNFNKEQSKKIKKRIPGVSAKRMPNENKPLNIDSKRILNLCHWLLEIFVKVYVLKYLLLQ